jgi:hypothetical protein
MKHIEHFKKFLKEEVNLNQSRLDRLGDRVASIEGYLRNHSSFSSSYVELIPQGSYAHRTIIKPAKQNKGFDADVLLHLSPVPGWTAEDYVENLYSAFRDSGTYKDMVGRKTRCVMVDYADDFHIDVVPFLSRADGMYVTNRHEDDYERTNPEGFTEWFEGRDQLAGGNLIPVMRLLKFVRDTKQNFKVKSFVFNTLVGGQVEMVDLVKDADCFADVPTTLHTVVSKLDDYLQLNETMPAIPDPSNFLDDLSKRWNQDEYANFRNKFHLYAGKIKEGFAEKDKDASVRKWREVFGEDFAKAKVVKLAQSIFSRPATAPPSEHFIEESGIPVDIEPSYAARLEATVLEKDGFRRYALQEHGMRVERARRVQFRLVTDVPGPISIKWKVRNLGYEALSANCLRGEITADDGTQTKVEPTRYKGDHYVEAYVIKDGVCVAVAHARVKIVDRL